MQLGLTNRQGVSWRLVGIAAGLLLAFFVLYWPVIRLLVRDWSDDNNSHGYLVVPLALYFVWERRERLLTLPVRPSLWGIPVVLGSLLMLLAGVLGAETFPARLSILTTLAGGVLFVLGWGYLKALAFPLGFMLLMIPIPALVFNEVAFPLQLLASKVAVGTLSLLGIPVLREGNVIVLANTSLEVAEACSGIRSLMSLVTLAAVYGYFTDPRAWVRVLYVLMALPVAIAANAFRVTATGLAAHFYGPSVADGVLHTFSGWLVFVAAFAMLLVFQRAVVLLAPPPKPRA